MKLIISGWPGCGSTTLSLLLSKNLNLKLYKGSETIRFFVEKLSLSQSGEGIIKVEKLIQPYWGPIYDNYIKSIFKDGRDNIIVDSDITGFLVDKDPQIFSIFLHSSREARLKHFSTDNRPDDGRLIDELDQKIKREYMALYNIDFLDLDYVAKYYSLLLDNSDKPIEKELVEVYKSLMDSKLLPPQEFVTLSANAANESKEYWEKGKPHYLNLLKEKDLVVNGIEIIKEIKKIYPDEVSKLPKHLHDIITTV